MRSWETHAGLVEVKLTNQARPTSASVIVTRSRRGVGSSFY